MNAKKAILILGGLAVAGGAAYFAYKKYKEHQEECDVYKVDGQSIEERAQELAEMGNEAYSMQPIEEPELEEDEMIAVNADISIELDVDDEEDHVENTTFEIISMEEFEGISTTNLNDTVSTTYYSNGVLMQDGVDEPLDIEGTVGSEAIEYLKNNEYANVIYVRNNDLGTDYEIVAVPEEYVGEE